MANNVVALRPNDDLQPLTSADLLSIGEVRQLVREILEGDPWYPGACGAGAYPTGPNGYDPWFHAVRIGASISYREELEFEGSANILGLTHFAKPHVTLKSGMAWFQERSTLAHELIHLHLGPPKHLPKRCLSAEIRDRVVWILDDEFALRSDVEDVIDEIAACRLLPDAGVVVAAVKYWMSRGYTKNLMPVSVQLGVDKDMVEARMRVIEPDSPRWRSSRRESSAEPLCESRACTRLEVTPVAEWLVRWRPEKVCCGALMNVDPIRRWCSRCLERWAPLEPQHSCSHCGATGLTRLNVVTIEPIPPKDH